MATAAAAVTPARAETSPAQAKGLDAPLPIRHVRPVPPGDEIVAGRGDPGGWGLYAASSGGGWSWQPLATLAPAGSNPNGERWIGRQCITGDGRYVVAVVAPWSANNTPAGLDRGGFAYSVNAHTGAVRTLVSGVSLYYFTPSCGPGSTVALTAYAGRDEQSTELVLADAADARVQMVRTLHGQYADAVPAPHGFYATSGRTIVQVSATARSVRARSAGQPFSLVANAAGGVDYLVGTGGTRASVWHLGAAGARRVGTGAFHQLALFEGRGGHTVAAGITTLDPRSGIVSLPRQALPVEAASLGGTAYSPLAAQSPATRSSAARDGGLPGTPLLLASGRAGKHVRSWTPATAAPPTVGFPPPLRANGGIASSGSLTASPRPVSPRERTARSASGTSFISTCAVPRNNVSLQAMQPSPQDVDWAANLAGRGLLTGTAARPQGFANLGLPGYSPSRDFPLPAPFGPSGKSIPREILEGIFAQESNFNQASWHSVQGVAGNPLIADYYGAGIGDVAGVTTPDCGYGIGQVTTGMHVGEMSNTLQRKVAVDYAENAAASAQLLAQKWNELAAAGIVADSGDTEHLEDWYLAIWDYNSGLHPNTGSGPWGLGWTNNPANPDYPYNRGTFLYNELPTDPPSYLVTYGDAATPGNWPYQEKVFGWVEVPLRAALTGHAAYTGTIQTFDPSSNTNVIQPFPKKLQLPGMDDFCTSANQCNPGICNRSSYHSNCNPVTQDGTGPCQRSDYECWWHHPDSWCSLLAPLCSSGSWEYAAGSSEPPAQSGDYYPAPTCAVDTSVITPGTDLVDSQAAAVNLQGCTPANENWRNNGSFSFSYGDPSAPGSQQTDMDVHQLGTGLGGHIWFTHTGEPMANGVSLWGVTGTWKPNVGKGRYEVKVFIPAVGASAAQANYTVSNGLGFQRTVTVSQNSYTDQWVSLGYFWLGPGATVSLSNLDTSSSGDLAFSGVAFVPAAAGTYAMLGDSYSSGEGAGNYDLDTQNYVTPNGVNNGHRSAASYNRVFAAGTRTFVAPSTRTDVACSGAIVADFFASNPNGSCPNEPGQDKALSAGTSLVTLTFGGNDLEFAKIITDCVKAGASDEWLPVPHPVTCEQKDATTFATDLAVLTSTSSSYGLPRLFAAIRAQAPNADVVVLGYPHLFVGASPGSFGRCLQDGWILDSDQDWLNGIAEQIDTALQTAAFNAGFGYLSTTSAFDGHELCGGDAWFTGIGDPTANDNPPGLLNFVSAASKTTQQQWFHPNVQGYKQEAVMLAGAVQVP